MDGYSLGREGRALGVPIHFLAKHTENTTLGQNTILLAKIQPSNKIQRENPYSVPNILPPLLFTGQLRVDKNHKNSYRRAVEI